MIPCLINVVATLSYMYVVDGVGRLAPFCLCADSLIVMDVGGICKSGF